MKKFMNIVFSIFFSLLIIGGIIRFTVGFKQLYYFDINYLDIPKLSNISEEEIRLNYDYLIDYNLSREEKDFNMPTIESSPQGKVHFEEVRDIFQNLNKVIMVCLFISMIGIFISIRDKNIKILNTTSKMLVSIPVILALPIMINFDVSFTIFHKLLFDNDYWIFDPKLDPVITILPEQFFFHAGVMILALILLSSIIIYSAYRWFNKKNKKIKSKNLFSENRKRRKYR